MLTHYLKKKYQPIPIHEGILVFGFSSNYDMVFAMNLLELFARYHESHRHPTNQRIHYVAVPAIYLSVLGLLWCIPPLPFENAPNWSFVALVPVMIYFFRLSRSLALGMLITSLSFLVLCWFASKEGFSVLVTSATIFFSAWIFQFIGHSIEGVRPSFADDLRFLLVGPLWVLAHLYQKLGIKFANLPKKTS